ncbi:ATP-binding protein [Enterococcus cecorum]|uniref:ATP-binding protein n=1 Tax=Enterococcus cecorum TaxID=44008 RepID=UPI002ACA7C6D|nr:AAA family ATPase [Enterococcus cecorum]MDZ5584066.1 AAA family ATPase [Enterococcus cecorum]
MKLLKAEITEFGKYRQFSFDFTAGNQLIFGANEAGKSTLYHFIKAMLFGFPKKQKRKRDYETDHAYYGGALEIEIDGEVLRIERMKHLNKGKATVIIGDEIFPESYLQKRLAPLDSQLFEQVFTFDQEQLQQITQLDEKHLQSALLSLGITGSQQLFLQAEQEEKERNKIFTSRGRVLPLNQKLAEYQALQANIYTLAEKQKELAAQSQQLQSLKNAQKDLQKQWLSLQKQAQQIKQQQTHFSLFEEYQSLQQKDLQLADAADVQVLQQFMQQSQQLSQDIQVLESRVSQLEQKQLSKRYLFYLDHEEQISQLLQSEGTLYQDIQAHKQITQQLVQLPDNTKVQETVSQEFVAQYTQIQSQLATLTSQLTHAQHAQQVAEEKLNQFEQQHPELFAQTKAPTSPKPLLITGFVGVLLSLLLMKFSPLFGGLVFVSTILLVGLLYLRVYRALDSEPIKQQWRLYLQDLDEKNQAYQNLLEEQGTMQEKFQALRSQLPLDLQHLDHVSFIQELAKRDQAAQISKNAQQQRQMLNAKLAQLNQNMAQFRKTADFLYEWLPIANLSIAEQLGKIRQFKEEMQQEKIARASHPVTQIMEQISQKRQAQQDLLKQNQTLLAKYQIQQVSDLPLWFRQMQERASQVKRKTELAQMLKGLYPDAMTKEQLASQEQQILSQETQLQVQKDQNLTQIKQIEVSLAQQMKDLTLPELYQKEEQLKAEIQELIYEWSVHFVIEKQLQFMADQLSESQLPFLFEKAGLYMQILTNQRYDKVQMKDNELFVNQQSIYQLSTGTKDQLIMALRFAYLAMQQKSISPVVIDDGWLHYDSQRKRSLAQLLAEFAKDYQVICLSSDREMVTYYQELHQVVKPLS